MAQTTLTYLNAVGATQTLEASEGASYKIPNNRIVDASGNFMPTMDAVGRTGYVAINDGTDTAGVDDVDGALSETANTWLQTASCNMAVDATAGAGSQVVPLQVLSTAVPLLKVGVFGSNGSTQMPAMAAVGSRGYQTITDGTNSMPTMDVVARKGFVLITDGTDSCAIEKVDAAVSETTVTSIRTIASVFALDAGAGAGSQAVPLEVVTGTKLLKTAVFNSTNQLPAGDAVARSIFTQVSDATTGPVAVKAASTAAVATDKALVVTLSPNNVALLDAEGGGSSGGAGTAGSKSNLAGAVHLQFASLPAATTGQQVGLQAATDGTLKVCNVPAGTVLTVTDTDAAAALSASLGAAANKMTYITGFTVTGLGATVTTSVAVVTVGLATNLLYTLYIPAGTTVGITPLDIRFPHPIPASAVNTAIEVQVPSFGAGNTVASVSVYGFRI